MPTKHLPVRPSLDHLKSQAKDLLKSHTARAPEALQRLREFHPRFGELGDTAIAGARLTLSDGQLTLAREYGYPTWTALKRFVGAADGTPANTATPPHHERIGDTLFRSAVELLDAGDKAGLDALLQHNPVLVRQRIAFEGENYFRQPSLLEFTAENPIRHGSLPSNIVEMAALILHRGAKEDSAALNGTLELVASGRIARECRVQIPLIDLLCDAGADAEAAKSAALFHGELEAVHALIRHGAKMDLPTATALGCEDVARDSLAGSGKDDRHRAVALAAQFGRTDILQLLLDIDEDVNRFNPVGGHSHSMPLHQAALHGHEATVRLLLEHGAKIDVRDILYCATPLDWALHAGQNGVADLLRRRNPGA